MVAMRCTYACFALILLATAALAQERAPQTSGKILPFKQSQISAAVKESTLIFNPQINKVYKKQEEEAAENLPPPIEIRPAGEGNTLAVGGIGNYVGGAPGRAFPGISETGWNPPDPHIAVGPNHIVEIVNMSIAFFNKHTGQQSFQQLINGPSSFFSSVGAGDFVFDPKAFFDPVSQRFFVLALDRTDSGSTKISKLAIGISDDADPAGTWYKYLIDCKLVVGSNQYWMDYPSFASNSTSIAVCGNMFAFSGSSGFQGTQFVVINKTPMLSGQATTSWSLRDSTTSSTQLSQTTDPTLDRLYAAAASSTTAFRMYALTNLTTTPVLTFTSTSVPTFSPIRRDAMSTNGRSLWTVDSRLFNAIWRGGKFYAAHHVSVSGSDSRHMARWYEIATNNWPTSGAPAVTQSGNVIGGATEDLIFPAINVNKFNDIAMTFTRCSPSITSDMMVTSRRSWDPTGSMGIPMKIQGGINPTYNASRWGDYFSTQIDPVDDATFWCVNMISNATGSWTTQILSWQATTDHGTAYYPSTISRLEGTSSTGNVEAAKISDDSYFTINTTALAGTEATYQLDRPAAQLLTLKVKVDGAAPGTTEGSVHLWNWNTSAYEPVGSFPMTATDQVNIVAAGGSVARFVSPTGQVKALFRTALAQRNVNRTPFTQKTDQLLVFAGWN